MTGAPGGMAREEAEALVRQVSAVAGFRGALQRLAGGPPDGRAWAVRVTAILTGGGGLVRSREAWERYRSQARQEVRNMAGTGSGLRASAASEPDGVVAPPGPPAPARGPLEQAAFGSQAQAPIQGVPGRRESRGSALERWRELTEQAVQEAEREAGRMLLEADRLRDRAVEAKQDARRLRRALALVTPPFGPEDGGGHGSIRARVLAWARAHGRDLVLGLCADELGLSSKAASDAASQLRADGHLERVGKGRYRLVGRDPGAAAAG